MTVLAYFQVVQIGHGAPGVGGGPPSRSTLYCHLVAWRELAMCLGRIVVVEAIQILVDHLQRRMAQQPLQHEDIAPIAQKGYSPREDTFDGALFFGDSHLADRGLSITASRPRKPKKTRRAR